MLYKSLVKPLLFLGDAETAHKQAVHIARLTSHNTLLRTLAKWVYSSSNKGLEQHLFGISFPNPIGLAAGFDKNGETPLAMQALGFGFVEVGSVTAKASPGNPKPRAFRLPEDRSLINRMGLNNQGADVIIPRLKTIKLDIPLGINIAKTNDTNIHGEAAIRDYAYSYELACTVADYITINISCPNTGEGKTFEDPDALQALLDALNITQQGRVPTLVKFSVDTDKTTLEKLVEISERAGIAGYVATNTSSNRKQLRSSPELLQAIGHGGLSGKAIAQKSTQVVQWLHEMLGQNKPIIGVGGIDSAEEALNKLRAGAHLLQLYTGMVYEGPGLVKFIKKELQKVDYFTSVES